MRDSIINKLKTNKLYIIPLVHFLLSFAYEHLVLSFDKGDFSPLAVVKSNIIPDAGERVMGYIISKLFAGIIIFLFWSLVFYVIKNIRKNRIIISFCVVFAAFLPVIFLLFPDSFIRSIDNLLTYSYAIRFYPEYWHSAYTSIVYCACLMVFPHPFSIAFLQWLFFIFVIGYIFTGAVRVFPEKKLFRWLLVLFFCIPGLFILITDPYRTELYALVCIFYVAFLMFELIEKKPSSTVKNILFILLSAFVGVWRTEGVILGVLGFVTYMIIIKSGIKKTAVYSACFVLGFILVFLPQKLGDSKYYSSDYTIINSFASLQNILNRSDADLDYAGAQEDLASIEKIVPIDLVKQFGLDGYRRYNYKNAHPDINQSTVSHEEGKAYVKAYYNILLHNPRIYLQTQAGMLKKVLDITSSEYVQYTEITLEEEYPKWSFPAWDNGLEDYLSYPGLKEYYYSPGRSSFAEKISSAYEGFRGFLRKTHISTAVYLIITGVLAFICIVEAVFVFRSKDKEIRASHIACFVLSAALIAQALAVILVMPAALSPYFHPYIFGAIALEVLYPYFFMRAKNDRSRF